MSTLRPQRSTTRLAATRTRDRRTLRAARRTRGTHGATTRPPHERSATRRLKVTRETSVRRAQLLRPPAPPIELTPQSASDPNTPAEVLWHIARNVPELRKWVVVNRAADANLLEYISQQGGPGVKAALTLMLESMDLAHSARHRSTTPAR